MTPLRPLAILFRICRVIRRNKNSRTRGVLSDVFFIDYFFEFFHLPVFSFHTPVSVSPPAYSAYPGTSVSYKTPTQCFLVRVDDPTTKFLTRLGTHPPSHIYEACARPTSASRLSRSCSPYARIVVRGTTTMHRQARGTASNRHRDPATLLYASALRRPAAASSPSGSTSCSVWRPSRLSS